MLGSARLYPLSSLRALKCFVEQTRGDITAGRLLPNDGIDLDLAAGELDLPHSAVRRALRPLEVDNLLHLRESNRAIVAPLNARELDRVFAIRRVVEPEIFASAVGESRVQGFAGLRATTDDFAAVDWRSDEIYDVACDDFMRLIEPFATRPEHSLIAEIESICERSQRIGYNELRLRYPTDLQTVAESYQVLFDACQMRKVAPARDAEIQFLELSEEICRLSLKMASVTSLGTSSRSHAT